MDVSNIMDLNHIYNDQFSYSLPREILENYVKGTEFDHKLPYTIEESQNLQADITDIYQRIIDQKPNHQQLAIMTAGAPGAGKTTLMRADREKLRGSGIDTAYICPDDICLRQMSRTWKREIDATEKSQEDRLNAYNKWRPGSNAACHLILANLILNRCSFHFGTTSTGAQTKYFLSFLKTHGYQIRLLHITAPDDVRWASVDLRNKGEEGREGFVQRTEKDTRDKGALFPQRIRDTYLEYADEIEFYYRDRADADARLSARWIRTTGDNQPMGKLEITSDQDYNRIVEQHNRVVGELKLPELTWENTVLKHSHQ